MIERKLNPVVVPGSGDKAYATREIPRARDDQPDAREGQAGRLGESERFIVPMKPGNAGGGPGPQFWTNART
jgi:hypothetical protein